MTKRFPKFAAHNLGSCFNCGGDFGDGHWDASGNAPGRGEFQQHCCKCNLWTWYDLYRRGSVEEYVAATQGE
jgi:hypothetical protein